jgi:hypothetical protein
MISFIGVRFLGFPISLHNRLQWSL